MASSRLRFVWIWRVFLRKSLLMLPDDPILVVLVFFEPNDIVRLRPTCKLESVYNLNFRIKIRFMCHTAVPQDIRNTLCLIACKSDMAELLKIAKLSAWFGEFLFSMVWCLWWPSQTFSRTIMNTNRQKNFFLETSCRSVDWPNFWTIKMETVTILLWSSLLKTMFSVAQPCQIYRL